MHLANIILKKEIEPELDIISADKIRFKQILINLLDNAIKFSKPQGGRLWVKSGYGEGTTFTFALPLKAYNHNHNNYTN